jgi:amino acid transporter
MVGIIVGSGIFRAPTVIANHLGSPALILSLWAAGGVLSLFGALAYAELGAMFPRSGGIYVYLHRGLGEPAAFVFGWSYLLLAKPFAAAGIILVFAEHLLRLLGAETGGGADWRAQVLGALALVALTAVNAAGTRAGTRLAVLFTGLKVLALLGIVGAGVLLAKGSAANFAAAPAPRPLLAALPAVLYQILFTYDGWADVSSVAGEIREPQRNLPRILLLGTGAVVALYLAVNAVYFSMIPLDEMRGVRTVAPLVAERLLGPSGGWAVTLLVVISTLGASLGSILTGARVTFAQARDGLLFRFLGRIHPRTETPAVALWVQLLLSCAAVAGIGSFEALAEGYGFTMWIFYALSVLGLLVLRARRPDLERPYRCPAAPLVASLFMLAALGVSVLAVLESPKTTLPWLGVLALGLPVYYLWRRLAKPGTTSVV